MNIYWITALSLGFLSSLHCLGMCGPIALALPLNRQSTWTITGGLFINHISRFAGYALLGLLAGTLGKGLSLAGFQNQLSIITGIMVLVVLLFSRWRTPAFGWMHRFSSRWKSIMAKAFGTSSPFTLSFIGLLNAFLPCGFVYMAMAAAAGTGHIVSGMVFMIFFGLGTTPALITVVFAHQLIAPRFREQARKFVPVMVSLLACLLIIRGMNLGIPYLSPESDLHTVHACCTK